MFAEAHDSSEAADIKDVLAANLRRLRIARHLSLSELARATGAGKATLSAIENGQANPTVGTLSLLAAALRVPLAELVEEPAVGEVRVVRAARGPASRVDGAQERAIDRGDGIELVELTLPRGHVEERPPETAGRREALYVLEGTIIAGPVERITELDAGDYAAFPADVARHLETGRAPARALLLRYAAP